MKLRDGSAVTSILRSLPSVDELLRTETAARIAAENGIRYTTNVARQVIEGLRSDLREWTKNGAGDRSAENILANAEERLAAEYSRDLALRVQRVINATGVIVHTNLGRAPLSENAQRAMLDAAGYASVEYDIAAGGRGKRGVRAESLICELTRAEAAIIVNNCAAAAFLVLTALAVGGEVIVSRGELVEIGGDFRIPDVLTQSGATLREVGTTNKTRLADYEKALGDQTKMVLKVHPSNYRIIGFSSSPGIADLAALAKARDVILYEDAGSGALIDLSGVGIKGEPVIAESIRAGVDIITFSGDKLLGGIQAGIISGRAELIELIRKHPLYRALRVDKIVYAALEATLDAYRAGTAAKEIPVIRMLSMTRSQLVERSRAFGERLGKTNVSVDIIDGNSVVGGGAAPDFQPNTSILALSHKIVSAERLEYALRHSTPPVIARIVEGQVLIDLRTVAETEEDELLRILSSI